MDLPVGFKVGISKSEKVIRYRSKGMGCMVFFVGSICLGLSVFFTFSFFFDAPRDFFGEDAGYIRSKPWFPYAMTLFYGAIAVGLFDTLWKIFGITEFRFTPKALSIRRSLFFLSRSKVIESSNLIRLQQIKDGGDGEDSFPSWGLLAYAPGKTKILSKEGIDKSDWLGPEIASYYAIPFERCPMRK